MTVKLVFVLRQQRTISTLRFQKAWKEERGPQIAALQIPLGLCKYIQVHRSLGPIDNSLRIGREGLLSPEPPFDIVEEFYFDCSMNDFVNNYRSDNGRKAWKLLGEIGRQYIEPTLCHILMIEERPYVLSGSRGSLVASDYNNTVRAVALVEAANGIESINYWCRSHAPLVQLWATGLGIKQYVQNHPYHHPVLDDILKEFGTTTSPFQICAAMWSDSCIQTNELFQQAMSAIREDEDSGFMRPNSMSCFGGKEHIFVDSHRA